MKKVYTLNLKQLKKVYIKVYNKNPPNTREEIIKELVKPLKTYKIDRTNKYTRYLIDVDFPYIVDVDLFDQTGIIPMVTKINTTEEIPTKENSANWENCIPKDNDSRFIIGNVINGGDDGWVYEAKRTKKNKDGSISTRSGVIKAMNLSYTEMKFFDFNGNIIGREVKYYDTEEAAIQFKKEVKMLVDASHTEVRFGTRTQTLAPTVEAWWMCKNFNPSRTPLPYNEEGAFARPTNLSTFTYNECNTNAKSVDLLGLNCNKVTVGFIAMQKLNTTFGSFIREKILTGETRIIAIKLQELLRIYEVCLTKLHISNPDAHLYNWMLDGKNRIYMIDFGRAERIRRYNNRSAYIFKFQRDLIDSVCRKDLSSDIPLFMKRYRGALYPINNHPLIKIDNQDPPTHILLRDGSQKSIQKTEEDIVNPLYVFCNMLNEKDFTNNYYTLFQDLLLAWKNGWTLRDVQNNLELLKKRHQDKRREELRKRREELLKRREEQRQRREEQRKKQKATKKNICKAYNKVRNCRDIKKIYRKQAKIYHPDKGGTKQEFQALTECKEEAEKKLNC